MDRNEVDHTAGESNLDIVQLYMARPGLGGSKTV